MREILRNLTENQGSNLAENQRMRLSRHVHEGDSIIPLRVTLTNYQNLREGYDGKHLPLRTEEEGYWCGEDRVALVGYAILSHESHDRPDSINVYISNMKRFELFREGNVRDQEILIYSWERGMGFDYLVNYSTIMENQCVSLKSGRIEPRAIGIRIDNAQDYQ